MFSMSHLLNPIRPGKPVLNIFGEHKTTEQTKVLSESDVHSVCVLIATCSGCRPVPGRHLMFSMNHLLNPIRPGKPVLNIFGEHKTTEQTKVLSESDVYYGILFTRGRAY